MDKKEGFIETILSSLPITVTGSPSFVWEQELKETKIDLKLWIKNSNNTPTSKKKEVVQMLTYMQMELEQGYHQFRNREGTSCSNQILTLFSPSRRVLEA